MWKAYKEKRIVHINVNIILAGIISTFLAVYPIYLFSLIIGNTIAFVLTSFLVDGIIDFTLFSILHALCHNKKKKNYIGIFAKDVLRIQKQRIAFTGIFFIFAVGGHFTLIELGIYKTPAYIISYLSSIFITRILHTIYGLKTGLFENVEVG